MEWGTEVCVLSKVVCSSAFWEVAAVPVSSLQVGVAVILLDGVGEGMGVGMRRGKKQTFIVTVVVKPADAIHWLLLWLDLSIAVVWEVVDP